MNVPNTDTGRMMPKDYYDARDLQWESTGCPVRDCSATLELIPTQWKVKLPYCPEHRIRIHGRSRTYVYLDVDSSPSSPHESALRNVRFHPDRFAGLLRSGHKVETHRLGHETSEDALTWNVFTRLTSAGLLREVTAWLSSAPCEAEPELYLWGIRIELEGEEPPRRFDPLWETRRRLEADVGRFKTEPDIMIRVPGQCLILIEAKFTAGNPVASEGPVETKPGEKPKSRAALLAKYRLPGIQLREEDRGLPLYSQLYRNLVFAEAMSEGGNWQVVNLVSSSQFAGVRNDISFEDPTQAIRCLLPNDAQDRFRFETWERLHKRFVSNSSVLGDLDEYMRFKSANGEAAFQLEE
jgi:hypothetical protein